MHIITLLVVLVRAVLAFVLAVLMGLMEWALGRLPADEVGGYVVYLVGVAAGRELYLDDPDPLWRDR